MVACCAAVRGSFATAGVSAATSAHRVRHARRAARGKGGRDTATLKEAPGKENHVVGCNRSSLALRFKGLIVRGWSTLALVFLQSVGMAFPITPVIQKWEFSHCLRKMVHPPLPHSLNGDSRMPFIHMGK